ncbi:MAG: VOC family protein [Myxococcales bacterium]
MRSPFFTEQQLSSSDPRKAKEFYQKLFGWKMEEMEIPGFGYRVEIKTEKGPSGAIMAARDAQPSAWLPYVDVEDLAATLARIRELGGKVVQEPREVPGEGTTAAAVDPTGALFKLWEPKRKA